MNPFATAAAERVYLQEEGYIIYAVQIWTEVHGRQRGCGDLPTHSRIKLHAFTQAAGGHALTAVRHPSFTHSKIRSHAATQAAKGGAHIHGSVAPLAHSLKDQVARRHPGCEFPISQADVIEGPSGHGIVSGKLCAEGYRVGWVRGYRYIWLASQHSGNTHTLITCIAERREHGRH